MPDDRDRTLFEITQTRSHMVINWHLERLFHEDEWNLGLTGFLYWARRQGAIYKINIASREKSAPVELTCVSGTSGEYQRWILWDGVRLCRQFHLGTHMLTQHGLGGLPTRFVEQLRDDHADKPFFKVRLRDKAHQLTYTDWHNHFLSGANERNIERIGKGVLVLKDGTPHTVQQTMFA